jgi:hypothetical protein
MSEPTEAKATAAPTTTQPRRGLHPIAMMLFGGALLLNFIGKPLPPSFSYDWWVRVVSIVGTVGLILGGLYYLVFDRPKK